MISFSTHTYTQSLQSSVNTCPVMICQLHSLLQSPSPHANTYAQTHICQYTREDLIWLGLVFLSCYFSPYHAYVYCNNNDSVKPILNWANVCSPNILRTVRRTMIHFLTELLVRQTWFGQFEEFTCSQLACNEMQASAQTCGRLAADSMI